MTTAEKKALIETAKMLGLCTAFAIAGFVFLTVTSVEVMIWLLLLTTVGFFARACYTFNLTRYREELKETDDKSV